MATVRRLTFIIRSIIGIRRINPGPLPVPPTLTIAACYCNNSRSYERGAEGPLFPLPGGDARLAAGLGYRENEFRDVDHIRGANTFRGSEGVRFAYAEFNLPLIGPDQQVHGIQRLNVTAAVRGEHYNTFGGVTTPKLGVLYGPNPDFTLKASWGRSFK